MGLYQEASFSSSEEMVKESKGAKAMSEIELSSGDLAKQVPNVIEMFQQVLVKMDDFRGDLVAAGDWQGLAHGVTQLMDFKKNLSMLIETIETNINEMLPEKKVVLPGVGIIEKRTSSSKKWDSEELLNHIVREFLDTGTGEITPTNVMNLIEALKKVLPLTPSLGWRSTALQEIGFDPKSYSDVTYGRKTISIKK